MTWSLTKVKTLEQCGAKYDFRYNQRIPDKAGAAAERGKRIHAELEEFIRGNAIKLTGALEFYYGFLTLIKEGPYPYFPEHEIRLAEGFTPYVPGPGLVSFLDLVVREPTVSNIFDWKTGKPYPDHDDQKELYTLAEMVDQPQIQTVKACHTYVDSGQNRVRTYTREADFERLKAKWTEKQKKLETTTVFIPNPQFLCRYCSYSKALGGPCRF
jgi:PD-(D/E)XK nuclease superfamily